MDARYATTALNVRKSASSSAATLTTLPKNTVFATLKYTGKNNAWLYIEYSSGKYGYVSGKNTAVVSIKATSVTASVLNVRSGPRTTFAKIDSLKKGERVVLLNYDEEVSWGLVVYRGTKLGFVYLGYLGDFSTEYDTSFLATLTTKNPVNVRESPESKAKILTTKRAGDYFVSLGTSGSWYLIAFPGDQMKRRSVGYLHSDYLMMILRWNYM
jgi:uncharacterized protein YgiM (DUF1202 family)